MTKLNQEQLIGSLKQLKEIKPRKEWAVLLKSQILAKKETKVVLAPTKEISFMDVVSSLFFQKKLAYSFAVVFFFVLGAFGFIGYAMPGDLLFPVKRIAEQSQAALTGSSGLGQDIVVFNNRINDLAQVAKDGRKDNMSPAINEVKAAAKSLKDDPTKNPRTLKDIASGLKTLADVPGTDLATNPDIKDLYQTVVQGQLADLHKTTLTDDQRNILTEIENLCDQGKYADALEKILLINK
ncbi:MAG: hypothetical protein NT155_01340 [Candidatus Staskawiczbacteria bacterium]|nr:hypothetical protein [Candidatus Staskawiczbacteria bacterium]